MNFVNFLACDVLESADANNKLLEVIIWGSLDFFK